MCKPNQTHIKKKLTLNNISHWHATLNTSTINNQQQCYVTVNISQPF